MSQEARAPGRPRFRSGAGKRGWWEPVHTGLQACGAAHKRFHDEPGPGTYPSFPQVNIPRPRAFSLPPQSIAGLARLKHLFGPMADESGSGPSGPAYPSAGSGAPAGTPVLRVISRFLSTAISLQLLEGLRADDTEPMTGPSLTTGASASSIRRFAPTAFPRQ